MTKTFEEELNKLIKDGIVPSGTAEEYMERRNDFIKKYAPQPLPEVPEFVAELVDYTVNVQHTVPSDIIDYFYFNGEQLPIEGMNLPSEILELEKLSEYFTLAYRRYDFEKACIIGYTVQKPKRFYLKNKLTTSYLELDKTNDYFHHTMNPAPYYDMTRKSQFTQEEIDSMQTGSYEKIEVEE